MKYQKMERKLFYTYIMVVFGLSFAQAQTRSTVKTKVILVVNEKSNSVTNLELFTQKNSEDKLLKKYPNSHFYLGMLAGDFELKDGIIELKTGAVIAMYTDKQLFSNKQFYPKENIIIGNSKTIIISNKKGEIIVKII